MGCVVVETAPTIARALRALAGEWPDVAVLDVNLGGELVTPVAVVLQEHGVPFALAAGLRANLLGSAVMTSRTRLIRGRAG